MEINNVWNMTQNLNSTNDFWWITDLLIVRTYHMMKYPSYLWNHKNFTAVSPDFLYSTTLLVRYGYPLLLAFGTVSNMLAFVFSLLTYRCADICIYFVFLSLADIFTLWTHIYPLMHMQYFENTGNSVHSSVECRLLQFLQHLSRTFAGWMVVVTTATRFCALQNPIVWKAKTVKFHVRVCLLSIASVGILCTPSLFLYDYLNLGVGDFVGLCHMMPKAFITYEANLYWNSFLFPIVPVLVVFMLNFAILYKLYASEKFRDRSSVSRRNTSVRYQKSSSRQQVVTLLTVSTLFLVLSTPHVWNSLRQLYSKYRFSDLREGLERGTGAFFNMESYWASFILYINNSINFYVYILVGNTLREEFMKRVRDLKLLKSGHRN